MARRGRRRHRDDGSLRRPRDRHRPHLPGERGRARGSISGGSRSDAAVRAVARALERDALAWATGGGEDYELLLTCLARRVRRLAGGLGARDRHDAHRGGRIVAADEAIRYVDAEGHAVARPPGVRALRDGTRPCLKGSASSSSRCACSWSARRSSRAPKPPISRSVAPASSSWPRRTRTKPCGAPTPLIERPHELLVTLARRHHRGEHRRLRARRDRSPSDVRRDRRPRRRHRVHGVPAHVFGEVLPMTLAVEHPETFLELVTARWLALGAVRSGARGARRAHRADRAARGARSARRASPSSARRSCARWWTWAPREGVVERDEREMIHKVFELEDTLVREVMVPRPDMFCLDVMTRPPREILRPAPREPALAGAGVRGHDRRQIVGVLYTKDLLPHLRGAARGLRPARPPSPAVLRARSPSAPTRCCGNSRPRSSTSPSWSTSTAAPRGSSASRTSSRSWSARSATSSTRRSA